MIATLLTLLQSPQQVETAPDPVAIVGKMLARYYNAKSLKGEILLTVKAGAETGKLRTLVQFADPGKLYIRQDLLTAAARDIWLVVSDGKVFFYPIPASQLGAETRKMLAEPVERDGVRLSHRDIYGIVRQSLKERSAPLDIAFGRYADLKLLKSQWINYKYVGREMVGNANANVIEGFWRPDGTSQVQDKYRMYVNDASELVRYEQFGEHVFFNDTGASSGKIQLRQTWDVNISVNSDTDEALYKVSGS